LIEPFFIQKIQTKNSTFLRLDLKTKYIEVKNSFTIRMMCFEKRIKKNNEKNDAAELDVAA